MAAMGALELQRPGSGPARQRGVGALARGDEKRRRCFAGLGTRPRSSRADGEQGVRGREELRADSAWRTSAGQGLGALALRGRATLNWN